MKSMTLITFLLLLGLVNISLSQKLSLSDELLLMANGGFSKSGLEKSNYKELYIVVENLGSDEKNIGVL